MGQYYLAVFLAPKGTAATGEHIRAFMYARNYENGIKLMEHSWINNKFMNAVEHVLSPEGAFYKTRLVWAGDYADPEGDSDTNLFKLADSQEYKSIAPPDRIMDSYRYIVNHTKQLYVDKDTLKAEERWGLRIHPLSLLTAEGNSRGGGDYRGIDETLVGSWARDIISVEKVAPNGFTELRVNFME